MNDSTFERAVREWLNDGSDRTPRHAVDAVLLAVKTTPQQRDLRIPWRFPTMNPSIRLAAAAVVAAVAIGGAFLALRPASTGGPATPSASAQIGTLDVSTWAQFESGRYGFSARYPIGFRPMPSSTFWQIPNALGTMLDSFNGTGPVRWLYGASMSLPGGMTQAAWIDAYREDIVADEAPLEPEACFPPTGAWTSVTIDGRAGQYRVSCLQIEALVFVDDRVYLFGASAFDGAVPEGSERGVPADFRALFDTWLTTITLDPASAISPTPAPSAAAT